MKKKTESKPREEGKRSRTGNLAGFTPVESHVARNQAAASDIYSEGLERFLDEYRKKSANEKGLKGFLFEYIEAAKFNKNAAASGKNIRSKLNARSEDSGGAHSSVDISIGGKQIQLKASSDAKWLAKEACKPKYDGMQVVVPKNMVNKVNRILEEVEGEQRRVVGELEADGASSGGTTTGELDQAEKDPDGYVNRENYRQLRSEVVKSGIYAAGAAAVFGGALSTVKNGIAYHNGKIGHQQALTNVAKDTAQSGVRGGATGVLGVGIRRMAPRLGVPMKSNAATAVAAATIEVGVVVYDYAKGEISAEEAGKRIGETACSAAGGFYAGAAAGALLGPVGAVVGSMVGYMVTTQTYQTCMAILQEARLVEEEAARIEALCAESVKEWNRRRREFEDQMGSILEQRHIAFSHCFALIDEALKVGETDRVVAGLAQLASMTGGALRFNDFEEFRAFMEQEADTPLVI
ncbi:MAG: hypothetical protein OXC63_13740 [Aestuariivita sp.]|nr:hypothetical protein [Aestuariivita sp.]MCY4347199.1 hypothetical protein [Aestuariivita sp.]